MLTDQYGFISDDKAEILRYTVHNSSCIYPQRWIFCPLAEKASHAHHWIEEMKYPFVLSGAAD